MSFFAGKKVYVSDIVTSPLIKNEDLPNYNQLLGIQGLKHPLGHGYIYKDFAKNGPAATARQLYSSAINDPLIGIPKSYKTLSNIDLSESIQAALDTKYPSSVVTLDSYYLSKILPTSDEEDYVVGFAALTDCMFTAGRYDDSTEYILDTTSTSLNKIYPLVLKEGTTLPYTHYLLKAPPPNTNFTQYYRVGSMYCRRYVTGEIVSYSKAFAMDYLLLTPEAAALPVSTLLDYAKALKLRKENKLSFRKNSVIFNSDSKTYTLYTDTYAIANFTVDGETIVKSIPFNVTSTVDGMDGSVFSNEILAKGLGYLPIIPLKQNFEWIEDNPLAKTTLYPLIDGKRPTKADVYASTKSLFKKTFFELDEVLDSIQSTDNGNDPSTIRSLYYGYFADVGTTVAATNKYLFEYFSFLATNSDYTKTDYDNWISTEYNRVYSYQVPIKDLYGDITGYTTLSSTAQYFDGTYSFSRIGAPIDIHSYNNILCKAVRAAPPVNEITISDNTYKLTLLYNFIEKSIVTGVIGEVGTVTKEIVPSTTLYVSVVPNRNISDKNMVNLFGNHIRDISDIPAIEFYYSFDDRHYVHRDYILLKKQISSTQYEIIKVHGLMHAYQPERNSAIVRTLRDAARAERDINLDRSVYVPIFFSALNNLTSTERALVLADTVSYIVYAEDYVKVKWYESASFLRPLQVVVVFVFTLAGLPQVGAGIAGLINFAIELFINILIMYISKQLFKLIIKEFGLENSLIAIAVAVVVAVVTQDFEYLNYSLNLIEGGLVGISLTLMSTITSALAAFNDVINDSIEDLSKERETFSNYIESKQEELRKAQDFLRSDNPELNYLLLSTRPKYILDKTPEDFYRRTGEIFDFPVIQDAAIDSFYDRKFDLDELYV